MRVLLVQLTLDPPGGGNAVAAWMLQALVGAHELTTLTEREWNPAAVDAFYGTSLAGAPIQQRVPGGAGAMVRHLPGRLDRLRMAFLLREAYRRADDFDLLVTADNYAAFKRPGLQYLHYPAPLRPAPHRLAPLVHVYYRACDAISGLSWEAAARNRSLANSAWTARHLRQFRGIEADVLYPPVADPGPAVPWHERTNTFLCVGRFHGSKRFEMVVSILDRVRAVVPDATLMLVGSNVDAEYTARLKALVRPRQWITVHEGLPQRQLFELMRRCRYGIHAMDREHFGMAPAEMARAGCIVFAHDSGGLVEVLDKRRELLWDTPERAVQLIVAMLQESPERQESLSAHLSEYTRRFSADRFVDEFRAVVANLPRR